MYARITYDETQYICNINNEYFFEFSHYRKIGNTNYQVTYFSFTNETDISALSYAQMFFKQGFRLSFDRFCDSIDNLQLQSQNYNEGKVKIEFSEIDFIEFSEIDFRTSS